MAKKRPLSVYILYVFFCLLVSLALAEIILRVAWRPPSYQFIVRGNDPIYHHSNREDHELATMDSWRRPILPRQSPDELRVFLVGDSFAIGMVDHAEQSVSRFIEEELNGPEAPLNARVYNMAQVSYSPIINYIVVKNLVLPNDPDVVLMIYAASDPADDAVYGPLARFDSQKRPVAVPPLPDYDLLPLKLEMAWIVLHQYGINHWQWNTYVQKRANRLGHYRDPEEKWKRAFERSMKYMGMTAQLCRENGALFLVVGNPSLVVLSDRKEFGNWLRTWGFDPDKQYRATHLENALLKASSTYDFPYVSLEPCVIEMERTWEKGGGKNSELFKVDDGHFTETGNRLIAKPIADFVRANLPKKKEAGQ